MGRLLKRLLIVGLGVGMVAGTLLVLLRAGPDPAQEEIDTHSRARLEQVLHEANTEEPER